LFFARLLLLAGLTTATLPVTANTEDLPSLGDSTSGYVSLQQEYNLGRIWLRQLRAQARTLSDPMLTTFLENQIYRLVPFSGLSHPDLEFVVIDQPNLNAFAVPGGIIGINYGLLLYARDEDEVSAVLAHELAHLSQRHYARRVEQAQRQEPVAIATLLASILLIATNNADAGFAGLMAGQAATIHNQLAFSREWEQEADRLGMKTLIAAGLDPHAMPSMFEQMLYANRFSSRPPEFLLTHPVTESRVADAAGRAEQYPRKPRLTSLEFLILKQGAMRRYQLDDSNTEDYFHGIRQRNPRGSGDYAAASYNLAQFASEQQDWQQAQKYLDDIVSPWNQHAAVSALQASVLSGQNKTEQALAVLNEALPYAPDSLVLLTSKASILDQHGDAKQAVDILKDLTTGRSSTPWLWQRLALAAEHAGMMLQAYRANGEYLFYSGQQARALRQMELALKEAKKTGDFQQQALIDQRLRVMAASQSQLN